MTTLLNLDPSQVPDDGNSLVYNAASKKWLPGRVQSSAGLSATQSFMGAIARNAADVKVLLIGDSTGDSTTEWFHVLGGMLAADWPSHSVAYHDYDPTTKTYAAPVTIATGTGARTINLYNASVAGANARNFTGDQHRPAIADVQPDLILVSLGHNEDVTQSFPNAMLGRFMALLEETTQTIPHADVIIIGQNPATANTNQAARITHLQRYASERGFGFIDVHQHWIDNEPTPGAWTADGIHPNTTGTQEWAGVVHSHFQHDPAAGVIARQPSSFLVPADNFITDGGFSTYTAGVPAGWTATNLTITKDTSRYDSPKGYSLHLQGNAVGQSTLNYAFPALGAFEAMLGQWVTVAVRLYVPAGSPSTFGRIALVAGGSATLNEPSQTAGQGAWRWGVLSTYVPTSATYLQLLIYANVSSSTGTADINVDRVIIARGALPRDTP